MSATSSPDDGFAEQGLSDFLLTVDDLETMVRAGVFARDGDRRVELVEGRLVKMTSESVLHSRYSAHLNRAVDRAVERLGLDHRFEVLNGGTVRISETSAFDPDGAVIARDAEGFFLRPDQVFLVIESSLTTLRRDLGAKSHAYAAAGIPEYWVIDVRSACLHVFRAPVDGIWSDSLVFGAADRVSPLFAPSADIALETVF
jgi:Uma2 family endonuclease